MQNDFSNELKGLKTRWDPVSEASEHPLVTSINPSYTKRVHSLLKRWSCETNEHYNNSRESMLSFGKWLRDTQRDRLSPSAWRSYRYQCVKALPYQDFISIVSVPPSTTKKDVVRSTSSNRRRHLKPDAVNTLEFHFSRSKSPYAKDVMDLVYAIISTGLRPSEWFSAQIELHEGYLSFLRVKNVKKGTQALSVPKTYRAVPLSHLEATQIKAVENTIARFRAAPNQKKYQKHLMNVFGRAAQLCFAGEDSRPSLYSARHQFAANLKQSGLTKEAIAAVMGHVSVDVQTHHYGRTVNGSAVLMSEEEAIMLNDLMT